MKVESETTYTITVSAKQYSWLLNGMRASLSIEGLRAPPPAVRKEMEQFSAYLVSERVK